MINKVISNKYFPHIITIINFLLSCLFMYNFYKCLSGYIANGFRDQMMMPTMFISYFTPVLCFLVYFYNYYVKELNKVIKWIYSIFIIALCIFNLVGIILRFDVYLSNNLLGVYESIPSIIVTFPFDGIIYNLFIIAIQIINILLLINKAPEMLKTINDKFLLQGKVIIHKNTYLIISILAILTFVFVGDFFCGFQAIENALYDIKYIYLLVWIFIVPLGNLLLIVLKPELRNISTKCKHTYLLTGIGVNLFFLSSLIALELIYPSFMVATSKPLFAITYSVSLPIEVSVITTIQIICSIIYLIRLIKLNRQHKENS